MILLEEPAVKADDGIEWIAAFRPWFSQRAAITRANLKQVAHI
jgi:hypothetical protein